MTCTLKINNEGLEIWTVSLSSSHQLFSHIEFKRGRSQPNYEVVFVDAKKFISLYENNLDSIAPIERASDWEQSVRNGLANFLRPGTGYPDMPRVSLSTKSLRKWYSFWKVQSYPVLTFGDGRHRVRYMEYAGADCLPIEVSSQGKALLEELCGV